MKLRFIIVLVMLILLLPEWVYGDGCVLGQQSKPVYEPSQRALIYRKGGYETIILQVRITTELDKIGWLIPLPAYPDVSEGPEGIFDELVKLTPPRETPEWSGHLSQSLGAGSSDKFVEVETDKVGIYEINRIKSNDETELFRWLNDNKFSQPDSIKPLLSEYIGKEFSFIAVRVLLESLNSEEKEEIMKSKWLKPLRIKFKSSDLFYPMKISKLNPGSTDLSLWILDKGQVSFPDAVFSWGGRISQVSLKKSGYSALPSEITGNHYLTLLTRKWIANSDIESDIYIQRLPGITGLYNQATEVQKQTLKGFIILILLTAIVIIPPYVLDRRNRRHRSKS